MSEIHRTRAWFAETTQIPHNNEPNVRQVAFYAGMQCEELAEKLSALLRVGTFTDTSKGAPVAAVAMLNDLGTLLKRGELDALVEKALNDKTPDEKGKTLAEHILDGDCDMLWVTIGAQAAQASDFFGAFHNGVSGANWAKRWPEDGKFHLDASGKVVKPDGWKAPDLKPFLHESLRGGA